VLTFGEPLRWHEYELRLHALPGHTLYAAAIEVEVDGKRILAVGDQQSGGERPILNYQYRNRFRIDDFVESAALYRELRPDLIVSGHWPPQQTSEELFARLETDGARLAELHRELLPLEEVDLGAVGFAARIEPYRPRAAAGETLELDVVVRNPFARESVAEVALVVPDGWAAPGPQRLDLAAHAEGVARFEVVAAAAARRARVAAEVTVDGVRFGQQAVAVVDVS